MKKARFVKLNEKQNQNIIKHQDAKSIRLNKFIADAGFSSRRGADKLISEGKVSINKKKAELGTRVFPGDIVIVNNKVIPHDNKLVYLVLNKDVGITSTTNTLDETNVVSYLDFKIPVFPIGRLDKDSSGLLLLTNDGDLVNKILRVEYGHEKEYLVTVNKNIDDQFINRMSNGVKIFNLVSNKYEMTLPCIVKKVNNRTFKIILKQGLNRQIRRMTSSLGYNVVDLKRIRIINVNINDLDIGEYRYLTNKELISINEAINQFEY